MHQVPGPYDDIRYVYVQASVRALCKFLFKLQIIVLFKYR